MEKIFDEYCKKHIEGPEVYCERVNMDCPPAFCHFICWGEWRRLRKEDVEVLRKKYYKPLTEEQKADKDLVTVIIPCIQPDQKYLVRTVEAVRKTAAGPIEIIAICDGWKGEDGVHGDLVLSSEKIQGQRHAMNAAARFANGKYLFRLDAHCNLTEGWDARMKESCKGDVIVTTIFDGLNTDTWKGTNRDNGFVRMTEHLVSRFVRGWKHIREREIEEETMGLSGTAFMILKDYYWTLGGCDEDLGEYGAIGTGWACKVWLTGGKCIIRTDVVCYHLFRSFTPFDIDEAEKERAYAKLYEQWVVGSDQRIIRPMAWLVMRFNHYLKARIWSQF